VSLRQRVQRAIASPVDDAQRLLVQTPHAGEHERLTILVEGWFRGLAAAIEEVAIELDELHRQRFAREPPVPSETEPETPRPAGETPEPRRDEHEGDQDEAALAERARASRKETETLRRDES
jgi:hypothetical protein